MRLAIEKRVAPQLFLSFLERNVCAKEGGGGGEGGMLARALYRDTTWPKTWRTRGVYSFGQPSSVGLIAIERSSLISSLSRSGEFEAGTATK